ncbi:hypothetical protein CW745_04175 [Psychromonas sp. psych-6C06]|nr:hypothetical protein CW745_04175 [Psychromonas sp. psych-6C06]
MSFLLKNRETLTQLFSTFSLQEVIMVNQNLSASWHLMTLPPAQIITAMQEKQVSIEQFLGKKCLPLIRFYLADKETQKALFLSEEQLSKLFISLPAVEAMVFKEQIQRAQLAVKQTNQALASLLSTQEQSCESLSMVSRKDPIVQFNQYQAQQKQSLAKLAEADKQYLDCFYYLQGGELHIVAQRQELESNMLLYSELSPLQQLKAQELFKLSIKKEKLDDMVERSASA